MIHDTWFAVNVAKRAARVRGFRLGLVLKELPVNSFDAEAGYVDLSITPTEGTKKDRQGFRSFDVVCTDNGAGCDDPEILRTVGSSTSDLNVTKRGRFGQGLIDVLSICTSAEICTNRFSLGFESNGKCEVSKARSGNQGGMRITATLRHAGDDFGDLRNYFSNFILPATTRFVFNGQEISHRKPLRTIDGLRLQTVKYDVEEEVVKRFQRDTSVELLPANGEPMIYELGVPVDTAPWSLPFDINVLQKTPLDTDRNILPDKYKQALISQLIPFMGDEYIHYMDEYKTAPSEIRDSRSNAVALPETARSVLVKTVTGISPDKIFRRNPMNQHDRDESQELENLGFVPLNRGLLPEGVSEIIASAETVSSAHDRLCKIHFSSSGKMPKETGQERKCMNAYAKICEALLGKRISVTRGKGNFDAAYSNNCLTLNIDVGYIWAHPLGENSIKLIIHECAHDKISGHGLEHGDEMARLGAKLAIYVSTHNGWWTELESILK